MTEYPLESTERERQRLMRQAEILRPFTARLLREAGGREGAAILDLGTGAGDVALLAAEIAGPSGHVVSIDRDPQNLAFARERALAAGLDITFVEGDISAPPTAKPFDVAIGRYVLMYSPDPVETVRGVARALRPGGTVAFHELNMHEGMRGLSSPQIPERFVSVGVKLNLALTRRVQNDVGVRLPEIFDAAGLDISEWGFEGVAAMLPRDEAKTLMGGLWRMFLPMALAQGLIQEGEADVDAYEAWFDSLPPTAAILQPPATLGWARKPG